MKAGIFYVIFGFSPPFTSFFFDQDPEWQRTICYLGLILTAAWLYNYTAIMRTLKYLFGRKRRR
jgi:hypothetical protein